MIRKTIWTALLICLITVPLIAQVSVSDSVAKYLAIGDEMGTRWDHKSSTVAYLKVLEFDPKNYEASWKAGDEYTEVANKLPEDQKKQKEIYFDKARELCEQAISINPNGWEGYFRLSVALGRLALFRGGKEKINLSKRIKVEADKAVELNPQADLAYHVLGRWHQNLANLSWVLKSFAKVLYGGVPPGSNEEAVAMFKKAIEINPTHIEHYLELARTYEFMGKKDLMREPLAKVLALPPLEEDDNPFKEEAGQMLKKL